VGQSALSTAIIRAELDPF